jgi:phospholipid transport system transporter-binding protein
MSDLIKHVKLSKNLTLHTVQDAIDRLLLKISHNSHVNFDLSEVKECDSAGLAFLIEAKNICDKNNINYSFSSVPEEIYSLAQFSGVEWILKK